MTAIRRATAKDLPAIERLLEEADLPTVAISDHLSEFLVAEDGNAVVACAGLETYGPSALLRSVVVRPDYRSLGLGGRLVSQLLDRARGARVRDVYLLTTAASEYFRRIGFEEVPREQIDAPVKTSREFSAESCATATAMHLATGRSG